MTGMTKVDDGRDPPVLDIPRQYNAVTDFIDRNLEAGRGDKTAYIDDNGSYSYRELSERVNRAGNALKSQGVRPESRVMACLLDSINFPSVFFGTIKIGAVVIPVNTLLTTKDYEFMLRDSRAQVLVVSQALYERFEPFLEELPQLETVLIADGSVDGRLSLSDLMESADSNLATADTSRDDVAFWLYTSGSTGNPKGAMHLQTDLVNTAVYYGQKVLGIRESDVVFSAAKMFFAYGLGNAISFPLFVGATTVVSAQRPTPEMALELLHRHNVTIYYGVPTLYGAIVGDDRWTAGHGSPVLRLCVSAGEALPEEVALKWKERFGTDILDGLGSTEMLHIFLSNAPGDIRYGTSGRAVPGYRLKVVDEEDREVAAGEIGELLVSGPSSAVAYWNNREKSLNTFLGPWTRTGDKYIVDEEGYYQYCGRTDDMLKVGGIWVSPFEVESALLAHESVLEAAVVGQADDQDLVKPKGFVVLKEGIEQSEALADELKQFVKNRIAHYKYPRWIEFAHELPKTATGKIQRYKLR